MDFVGRSLWSYKKPITVEANSSQKVFQLQLDSLSFDKKAVVMITSFKGTSSNFYFSPPKDLELPITAYSTNILKTNNGFNISIFGFNLLKDAFFAMYLIAIFSDATVENKSIKVGFLSIITALTQFFGYGLGFLESLLFSRTESV